MSISKKKQNHFDKIFILVQDNHYILDIELFRKLFDSDNFDIFINYIKNKIVNLSEDKKYRFNLHVNSYSFSLSDLYYYQKILQFAKLLNEFTETISNIYIYECSYIFTNLILQLNNSLGIDSNSKIVFESKDKFNKLISCL